MRYKFQYISAVACKEGHVGAEREVQAIMYKWGEGLGVGGAECEVQGYYVNEGRPGGGWGGMVINKTRNLPMILCKMVSSINLQILEFLV